MKNLNTPLQSSGDEVFDRDFNRFFSLTIQQIGLSRDERVKLAKRLVDCFNAMEGIEDPQKFMEQRANNGWICVKDAMPEKGKEVFAHFQNIKDKPRVIKAFFINRFSVEAEHFEGDAEYDGHGNAYWPEGWYENNEFEEVHCKVDATITHWMPIPEPPKQ